MENSPPLPLAVVLFLAMGGSLLLWVGIAVRRSRGQPIVPFEPRRPVPWGAVHLAIVLIIFIVLQILGAGVAMLAAGGPTMLEKLTAAQVQQHDELQPGQELKEPASGIPDELIVPLLLSNAISSLLVVALTMILFRVAAGASGRDFGLRPWRPDSDLLLGAGGFLVAMLPVYAIQAVLTQFFPSKHPVTTLLSENSDGWTIFVCVFAAVIVAPIAEEFLFRVVLQGWLEAAVAQWRADPTAAFIGHRAASPSRIAPIGASLPVPLGAGLPTPPTPSTAGLPDTAPSAAMRMPTVDAVARTIDLAAPAVDAASPHQSPQAAGVDSPKVVPETGILYEPGTHWQSLLPMLVSSMLFALMHLGHGPDPIPLFVLAMILGYLYQRTHRLWPCIVLHMCLNGTSLIVLGATMKSP